MIWYGHINRMNNEICPKRVLEYTPRIEKEVDPADYEEKEIKMP